MNKEEVVLFIDAPSGIRYQTAEMLLKQGYRVGGIARRVERMDPLKKKGLIPLKLDITQEASIMGSGVKLPFSLNEPVVFDCLTHLSKAEGVSSYCWIISVRDFLALYKATICYLNSLE